MKLKELARIEMHVGTKCIAVHRTLEDENGSMVVHLMPRPAAPDLNVAEGLLTAASDFLAGSTIGQLVMASISMCRAHRMRIDNEKGMLSADESADMPF